MPQLMCRRVAALALVAAASHAVQAQQATGGEELKRSIVARAKEVAISREVVDYVAANARGTRFEPGSRPDLETRTPETITRQLCGSLQPGYLERLG